MDDRIGPQGKKVNVNFSFADAVTTNSGIRLYLYDDWSSKRKKQPVYVMELTATKATHLARMIGVGISEYKREVDREIANARESFDG